MDVPYARPEPLGERLIRRFVAIEEEVPQYIEPPQLILTNYDSNPNHAVLTAVCWLLARKPQDVQTVTPLLTEGIAANLAEAMASPITGQALAFVGMSGLMTLVKEVKGTGDRANYEYLFKRWKAMCATQGIRDVIETREMSSEALRLWIAKLEGWQIWVRSRQQLRVALIDYCIQHKEGTLDATPFTISIMEQVRMVFQNFGMKSILLMNAFPNTNNKAILLASVASQAVVLRAAMEKYSRKYGEYFPYMRVYPLDGIEEVHHRLYPDLYYATVSNAIHNKEAVT